MLPTMHIMYMHLMVVTKAQGYWIAIMATGATIMLNIDTSLRSKRLSDKVKHKIEHAEEVLLQKIHTGSKTNME